MDQLTGDTTPEEQQARIVTCLVEAHYQIVYRFAYRLSGSHADAEDLTQQAFLIAQQKLEQLREAEKCRSWLLTIVRNSYLKGRRKSAEVPTDDFDRLDLVSVSRPTDPEDQEALQAALLELPDEFRVPVILFYFNEMTYKQIAAHLDIPIGTVMSRLSRGKAYLRNQLSSEVETPARFSTAISELSHD